MNLRPVADIEDDIRAGQVRPPAVLFRGEPMLLTKYAMKSPGPIVEIGSYHGGGTVLLAKASKAGNGHLVYAIDRHETEGSFPGCPSEPGKDWKMWYMSVVAGGVCDIVRPIGLWSWQAWDSWKHNEAIGLLWIDGLHTYEATLRDFQEWRWNVRDDGHIAFHDTHMDGPRRVCEEIIAAGEWKLVDVAGTLAVFARAS